MCEPRHQHLTSVNSEDYRDRRCIARVPLVEQSKTLSSFLGPTDGCSACSLLFFGSAFPSSYHGTSTFLYLYLDSVVSKPHPTEGAEKYTGCGIPRCYIVCCAMCTSLCAGCCARCMCCSLFFRFLSFSFSNWSSYSFGEINKTRTSTSTLCTAHDTCVACLRITQFARDSLYSTGLLPSSHSGVDASAGHAAVRILPLRSVISDQNTATTTPPLRFFAATLSNRSVISPKDHNNVTKFKV